MQLGVHPFYSLKLLVIRPHARSSSDTLCSASPWRSRKTWRACGVGVPEGTLPPDFTPTPLAVKLPKNRHLSAGFRRSHSLHILTAVHGERLYVPDLSLAAVPTTLLVSMHAVVLALLQRSPVLTLLCSCTWLGCAMAKVCSKVLQYGSLEVFWLELRCLKHPTIFQSHLLHLLPCFAWVEGWGEGSKRRSLYHDMARRLKTSSSSVKTFTALKP